MKLCILILLASLLAACANLPASKKSSRSEKNWGRNAELMMERERQRAWRLSRGPQQ